MTKQSRSRAADTKAAIERAGNRLAPSHALSLDADGASEEEMAHALGIPIEAVAPLLQVARAKLARTAGTLLLLWIATPLPAPAQFFEPSQVVTDGVDGVDGLAGVRHVAVSPDGRNLYAAANDDSAIAVFAIEPSGRLRFEQVLEDDSVGGTADGLQNARHLALSPDGANVYVAAYNEFAVSAFTRDPATGHLAFGNEVSNPSCCSVFTSLNEVATSPDGADVYTVSNGYAAALDRGLGGALALLDHYAEASDSFGRGFALAVSPDGAHVYVGHDTSLEVAARDATGALTFVAQYDDGLGGVDGLDQPETIAISDDGLDVYVGSYNDSGVAHFWRDPATGLLEFRELTSDAAACADVNELRILSDGSGLVGSCVTSLVVYERDPETGALAIGLSVPQESIGAVQIQSAAVLGETLYVASEGTDSIVVIGAPEPARALASIAAFAALSCIARRRSAGAEEFSCRTG